MIELHNVITVDKVLNKDALEIESNNLLYEEALFFDLEHYIYKKPVCVGVFGCCYFDKQSQSLNVTQYMIEGIKDSKQILFLAKDYFNKMKKEYGKKYIVTFSGNNDFTVINYLFKKYGINICLDEYFVHIDLQKHYEKEKNMCIGLKALEKEFGIERDSELISGSNLAKTFSKIMKDEEYIDRMPEEKKEKILLYNQQDVVSLFHMYVNWNSILKQEKLKEELITG